METKAFPVIDMSPISKYLPWKDDFQKEFSTNHAVKKLADEIADAFTTWGFIYMQNHGIDKTCINDAFEESHKFFQLDNKTKESLIHGKEDFYWGYTPYNVEKFEKNRPFDLKECFNFFPTRLENEKKMNAALPNFIKKEKDLFDSCHQLSTLLMYLLSMKLPVDDINFLHKNHSRIGHWQENSSLTRLLYYPPVSSHHEILEDQLRCGEHSDYTTFTFLFQNGPGLQVVNPSGEFIDATPIPNTIVVNAGDFLEMYSAGKFKSTRHRVALPKNMDKSRQSIGFFYHPDRNVTVSCLDGSDKYKPVKPFDYLLSKVEALIK